MTTRPVHLKPQDLDVAALLVIDMQNGFCSDVGGLANAGVDISRQQAVVPRVAELVGLCRRAEIPVVWTKTVHYPQDATRARRRIPSQKWTLLSASNRNIYVPAARVRPCVRSVY